MDPISQGALGAVAALSLASKPNTRKAALIGWAGGMLADADIFIRSSADPLLNIEFHRQFTHSLIFIPIGGLICAALFHFPFGRYLKIPFKTIFLYATAGFATAGLLDACTSYGTQLLWPFSNARIAWNNISIIDPVFTITLLIFITLACLKKNLLLGRYALSFALGYLIFGTVQRDRAQAIQQSLAQSRGHDSATRLTVKPSIGNLILWRSIYQHEDQFHVDAIRLGLWAKPRIYPGSSLPVATPSELKKQLPAESALAKDIDRFAHFSDHYLAFSPNNPKIIGDVRYASVPNSINPIWGISFDPDSPNRHAPFVEFHRVSKPQRQAFLKMILNEELSQESPTP